jgi:MoaA/NifB/PqqE/SkfB family radical SAM enzyme
MSLEDIGFYTLSDKRAENASDKSPLQRCEMILTDRCNFKCTYCRGLREDLQGDLSYPAQIVPTLNLWIRNGLRNVRFSGGEPTLHPLLSAAVRYCSHRRVKRIAISTNGATHFNRYEQLIRAGANDFSVSLDACCASMGEDMAGGVPGVFEKVTENIKRLAERTYVSVGVVFTEDNIDRCVDIVRFADSLGVADIRVIPSAQYDAALLHLSDVAQDILVKYPILKYRTNNVLHGRHIRGIRQEDTSRCPLVLDDMAVAGGKHFPCIIYMREQGKEIGRVGPHMRQERLEWFRNHNSKADSICRRNCLDVCIDYNNCAMKRNKEVQALLNN